MPHSAAANRIVSLDRNDAIAYGPMLISEARAEVEVLNINQAAARHNRIICDGGRLELDAAEPISRCEV